MTESPDGSSSSDGIDPYAPPRGELDPEADWEDLTSAAVEFAPDRGFDKRTFGRVCANLLYLAKASFGRVGTAWLLVVAGYTYAMVSIGFPTDLEMGATGVFDVRPRYLPRFGGLAPFRYHAGCTLAGLAVAALLVLLVRLLRRAGLGKTSPGDGSLEPYREAVSRFGPTVATLVTTAVAAGVGAMVAVLVVAWITSSADVHVGRAAWATPAAIAAYSAPLHYSAAVHDASLADSANWAKRVVLGDVPLVSACVFVSLIGGYGVTWLLTAVDRVFDPAIPAAVALGYLLWLWLAATCATLEERPGSGN